MNAELVIQHLCNDDTTIKLMDTSHLQRPRPRLVEHFTANANVHPTSPASKCGGLWYAAETPTLLTSRSSESASPAPVE